MDNPTQKTVYDPVARWLHWGMALLLFTLCGLGFYATSLTYYHPLYKTIPDLHRALGLVAFVLVIVRLLWRKHTPPPAPEPNHKPWELMAAHTVHHLLYLLMFTIPIAGFLLSTADGRPVNFFGLLEIPTPFAPSKGLETTAGYVHLVLGVALLALASLHAMAALKHHFIDHDHTLLRMMGQEKKQIGKG